MRDFGSPCGFYGDFDVEKVSTSKQDRSSGKINDIESDVGSRGDMSNGLLSRVGNMFHIAEIEDKSNSRMT